MLTKLHPTISHRISASPEQISEFCQRWGISEFALFGSILRDDFRDDSDIDVLLTFSPERWFTLDDWLKMQEEIELLLMRNVDLVSKSHLKNPYRRHEIINTCQVLYAVIKS